VIHTLISEFKKGDLLIISKMCQKQNQHYLLRGVEENGV